MTTKPPSVQHAEKIAAAQRAARDAVQSSTPPTPTPKPDRARGRRDFAFSTKARPPR